MSDRKKALAQFSELLRRYRQAAGHSNARSFFEAQGGRTYFGCTYRAYLNVEKGLAMPQPAVIEKLIAALWIAVDEPKAREFAPAYLRALFGFDDFLEFALTGLSEEKAAAAPAGGQSLEQDVILTPEQARLLYESEECYWCFTALANDAGRWKAEELAGLLDLPLRGVAKAVAALKKAGLAACDKEGRWSCGIRGRVLFHAEGQPDRPQELAALRGHWDRMAKRRGGGIIQEHPVLTRCSESEFRNFFPFLVSSLLAAGQYARKEKGADTALFLVEVGAQRLLPL